MRSELPQIPVRVTLVPCECVAGAEGFRKSLFLLHVRERSGIMSFPGYSRPARL